MDLTQALVGMACVIEAPKRERSIELGIAERKLFAHA